MDWHPLQFDMQITSGWNRSLIAPRAMPEGALSGETWALGRGVSTWKEYLPEMPTAHSDFCGERDPHSLQFDVQMSSGWNSNLMGARGMLEAALAGRRWRGVSIPKGSLPEIPEAHSYFREEMNVHPCSDPWA